MRAARRALRTGFGFVLRAGRCCVRDEMRAVVERFPASGNTDSAFDVLTGESARLIAPIPSSPSPVENGQATEERQQPPRAEEQIDDRVRIEVRHCAARICSDSPRSLRSMKLAE